MFLLLAHWLGCRQSEAQQMILAAAFLMQLGLRGSAPQRAAMIRREYRKEKKGRNVLCLSKLGINEKWQIRFWCFPTVRSSRGGYQCFARVFSSQAFIVKGWFLTSVGFCWLQRPAKHDSQINTMAISPQQQSSVGRWGQRSQESSATLCSRGRDGLLIGCWPSLHTSGFTESTLPNSLSLF